MGSKGSRVITDKLDVYVNVITKLNPSVMDLYKIIDTMGAGTTQLIVGDCFTSAFLVKHS